MTHQFILRSFLNSLKFIICLPNEPRDCTSLEKAHGSTFAPIFAHSYFSASERDIPTTQFPLLYFCSTRTKEPAVWSTVDI